MSEYNRHRWAMEWMHGGGRDPKGRSLDDEIRIGKEDWLERQRVAQGGRIGLQSGQLVQPGPGRQGYGGRKVNWTPERKANLKTWMENTGSTLKDYNERSPDGRFRIREGDIWGKLKMSKEALLKQNQADSISKLTPKQKNKVLGWGRNKGKGKWSNEKILKEYSMKDNSLRYVIKTGEITGKGFSTTKGAVKSLSPENQRFWNKLNPDLKWEDYKGHRGNWVGDVPRKKKILEQTKGLITEDELAKRLTEEFGEEISKRKVYGRHGEGKTHLAAKIDERLFKGTYGTITGEGTAGQIRYFKPPTERDFRKLKPLIGDVRINTLKPKMVKAVIGLDKKYADIYKTGNVPLIKDVVKDLKLVPSSAGNATARLAQIYSGHVFNNPELEAIRINKAAGNKMFRTLERSPFGDPYRAGIYRAALETIDEKLGNKKGTFEGLKKQARQILKDHNLPVYSKAKPFGFNINEIAGVTGSSKSGAEFSQYIDIMEGNLNEKILANYQGQLSKYREMIQKDPSKLPALSETINIRAGELEKAHGIKLPRLLDPSKADPSLKAASQQAKYTLKIPKGAQTIAQFVKDPTKTLNSFVKTLQIDKLPEKLKIELAKIHNCPIKVSSGGRIGFDVGGNVTNCLQTKLKNDPMKFLNMTGETAVASKSKNMAKFLMRARGAARITGIGAAWEAAFAPLMAGWMMPEGESPARIFNEIAYGLPIVGETEKEEKKRHMGETGFNVDQLLNLFGESKFVPDWDPSGKSTRYDYTPGERDYLQKALNAEINRAANTPGKSYKQYQIEQQIKKLDEKGRKLIDPFYEGPAGQYFGSEKWRVGEEARAEGLKSLEQSKAAQLKEYQDQGWVAKPGWEKKFRTRRMGGGIMGLKK